MACATRKKSKVSAFEHHIFFLVIPALFYHTSDFFVIPVLTHTYLYRYNKRGVKKKIRIDQV